MTIAESLSFYLSTSTAGSSSVPNQEVILNTTPSTSTTTGALVVSGGVGIAGTLTLGGGLLFGGVSYAPTSFTPQGWQGIANGINNSYALNFNPPSANALIVTIDGLVEYDYTVNGNNLIFGFIPDQAAIIRVFCFGVSGPVSSITPGSVTSSSFAAGAIVGGLGYTPLGTTSSISTYLTGTNLQAALTPGSVWFSVVPVALPDASTIALDFSQGINFSVQLTSAVGSTRVIGNPSNIKPGQTGWIQLTQSASGSNSVTFGNQWHWAGGTVPTVTTTANAQDLLYYTALSSNYILGNLLKNVV